MSDRADRRADLGGVFVALQRLTTLVSVSCARLVPDDLASPSLAVQVPVSAATPAGGMRTQAVSCYRAMASDVGEQGSAVVVRRSEPILIEAFAAFLLPRRCPTSRLQVLGASSGGVRPSPGPRAPVRARRPAAVLIRAGCCHRCCRQLPTPRPVGWYARPSTTLGLRGLTLHGAQRASPASLARADCARRAPLASSLGSHRGQGQIVG
jgi:hypothetical protein